MKDQKLNGYACYTFNVNIARSPISNDIKQLVLESDPNPNYYSKGNFPPNKHVSDWHIYIPIKNSINCFQDIIIRNTAKLQKEFNLTLQVFPGQITLYNEEYQAVRINTNDINHIPLLINEMKKLGIEFLPDKNIKEYESLIYYKKYTEFIKIEDDVYVDSLVPDRYFFSIPTHIEFNTFIDGMSKIKNSCNFHLFDSFLVYLIEKNNVHDFIGIYSKHCDKNRFSELKDHIKTIFHS